MDFIKRLLFVLTLISVSSSAFEFNNSTAPYDFSQTIKIFIVDQKNSKFFGMFDPFEMKITTLPSRFYVAVMGVVERGHRNAKGVSIIDGKAVDYEYELIFRSLNNSHVMFIGKSWIIDGNKKIAMTKEEIRIIYEHLLFRSTSDEPRDMSRLDPFFKEINEQQDVATYPQLTSEDELESIHESKKMIEDRLPKNHNDTETLPYYNKALENEKFLEEYEKTKKLKEKNAQPKTESGSTTEAINKQDSKATGSPLVDTVPTAEKYSAVAANEKTAPHLEPTPKHNPALLSILIGLAVALSLFALYKWKA